MNLSAFANRLSAFLVNFFSLSGQLVPQSEAEAVIRDGVSFRGTNIIILVLAILIASLGLNTNSTAVIIGAMLISPLMGPIIGVGLGVGIHDFELIKRAVRNLVMAAGLSVIASTLYFVISPVGEVHSELLARTSPTIYDVLIGFVGGGAGIVAIGSRSKGNVIPGVAIATALMPPLCTAGYGLATLQFSYFFGAFYLFLINSVYIALATFIGVKLMKYKGSDIVNDAREHRVRRIVYIVAFLAMLPSLYLTYTMLRQNAFSVNASRFVRAECHFPATQVLSTDADISGGHRTLTITLIGRVLPADSLEMALTSRLAAYRLEGTRIRVIQGSGEMGGGNVETMGSGVVRDLYQATQLTIERQQQTIDSLRAVSALAARHRSEAAALIPELRVLFPQVGDISMVREAVFGITATGTTDTVNVAMVHFTGPMPKEQRNRLAEYLQARLGLSEVSIIEVGAGIVGAQETSTTSNKSKHHTAL